jgi:23S rRNA (guanosine2251-2'-O)-methyltransferase
MVNAGMGKRNQTRRRGKTARLSPSNGHRQELWIYGHHAALAVMNNPERQIQQVLATRKFVDSCESDLPDQALKIVDRLEIDKVLPENAVHQGIAVLTDPLPDQHLDEILAQCKDDETAILIVLDHVTDPRNVGAVMRSAAAFGCAAVIVHDRHTPPVAGALSKAASGALEVVPLVSVGNLAQAMKELKEAGFWCVGLEGAAPHALAEINLSGKTALFLGAEGAGLRRLTRENCDALARIPMNGQMESLNLSNATAIALYEATRAT